MGVQVLSQILSYTWKPSGGEYGPRKARRQCDYEAYVPDVLTDLPLTLPLGVTAEVSRAEQALTAFEVETEHLDDFEHLARFLLRAEAVASSKIEGLQVGPRRLAQHEVKSRVGIIDSDATADAVLGNIAALRAAVESLAAVAVVDVQAILAVHRALMDHSDTRHLSGVIRDQQNWLGGNDHNPCGADFVPPPPEYVGDLLTDLCNFVNRDDLPPVVQAAVAHAQFETIHPFADGNGRTGRALVSAVLRRRGLTPHFVPPISLVLATRAREYVAGLTAFRYVAAPDSPEATAGVASWIETFAAATVDAAHEASELRDAMLAIEAGWREKASVRRGSAADRLLRVLLGNPVVTPALVMELTRASRAAAFAAVDQLVSAGVLSQIGSGARHRLYEARDVLDLLADVERSLATPGGDTRTERPARHVPARRQ
ncbi:MAG: Fic family protein [Nocardioidaceae bacterium]